MYVVSTGRSGLGAGDELGKLMLMVAAGVAVVLGTVFWGGKQLAKRAKVKDPALWGAGAAIGLAGGYYLFMKRREPNSACSALFQSTVVLSSPSKNTSCNVA